MKMRSFFAQHKEWYDRVVAPRIPHHVQLAKLMEEVGEAGHAICRYDADKLEDAIGDIIITACGVARRFGVDPEKALARAWTEVQARTPERVANQCTEAHAV